MNQEIYVNMQKKELIIKYCDAMLAFFKSRPPTFLKEITVKRFWFFKGKKKVLDMDALRRFTAHRGITDCADWSGDVHRLERIVQVNKFGNFVRQVKIALKNDTTFILVGDDEVRMWRNLSNEIITD